MNQPPSAQLQAKICGLTSTEHALLAAEHGADMLGFVHYPKSPRHISPADVAPIAAAVRGAYPAVQLVAVIVNPADALVDEIMAAYAPDFLQLHGKESPAECQKIKEKTGAKIIKAISVSHSSDLDLAQPYMPHADMLMLDAKAGPQDALPGGNGRAFDWSILSGKAQSSVADWPLPWLLSGGLTPENLSEAWHQTHAPWVDVSSGVEYEPGKKDSARIQAFLEACRNL